MISVIIPLYNKEISVKSTLESVLAQSFKQFEILIVNDGSTDNSIDVVNQLTDKRIRVIEKANGGVSSARNLGIKEAKFDWISFLDADDRWFNNHLSNAFEIIQNKNDVNVISTGFAKAKKDETIIKEYHVKESGFYDFFEASLDIGFATNSSSIFFNKKRFHNFYFDERFTKGEDTRFWENLGKEEKFYFISDITSLYLIDAENSAIKRKHKLEDTHIYNLSLKEIENNIQLKYYKRQIYLFILYGFLGLERRQHAFKILKKYWGYLDVVSFVDFVSFAIEMKSKKEKKLK